MDFGYPLCPVHVSISSAPDVCGSCLCLTLTPCLSPYLTISVVEEWQVPSVRPLGVRSKAAWCTHFPGKPRGWELSYGGKLGC